ncbi:MAG: ROK family protein [Muribaculaceae bacterium]
MKNNLKNDNRVVLTLDAGGTNFVFSAIKGGKFITDAVTLPANADNIDRCLETMVAGFESVKNKLTTQPVAISFAFPGPADYPNGIIGGYLPNFPSFRNGVALGEFLKEKFGIPVFINNDADLFAYGEALMGKLPEINSKLKDLGSNKQYNNLLGYTFGTGFGFGFVSGGQLHIGDNSCVETFCLRHKNYSNIIVEDGVSVRAIKRVYSELSNDTTSFLEPKDIYDIAEKKRDGDSLAAIKAFEMMGEIAGDAMASAVTLIDGIIVIGGGITAAKKYIMPALLQELRSTITTINGDTLNRVQMKIYDLDNECEFKQFAMGQSRTIKVYGSNKEVNYDFEKRIGVAISKLGASDAISIGAAAFALNEIDKENVQH